MSDSQPIGDLLDSLGVATAVPEGALVSSALVVLAVVRADGSEILLLAPSEGQSWVTRRGLLEVALDAERCPPGYDNDEDGDA